VRKSHRLSWAFLWVGQDGVKNERSASLPASGQAESGLYTGAGKTDGSEDPPLEKRNASVFRSASLCLKLTREFKKVFVGISDLADMGRRSPAPLRRIGKLANTHPKPSDSPSEKATGSQEDQKRYAPPPSSSLATVFATRYLLTTSPLWSSYSRWKGFCSERVSQCCSAMMRLA